MNHLTSVRRAMSLGVLAAACLGTVVSGSPARAADKATVSAEALLYSTMPSLAAHRIEMALDGDPSTYYKTVYGMDDGDDFIVLLSQPIPMRSFRIITGDQSQQDLLTDGFVETSPDGVHYTKAASFDSSGVADAVMQSKPVEAIRIRVTAGHSIPALVIREIMLNSPDKITHVQMGPGRGFPDISRAPEVAVWAQKAESQMESFWADTDALLYTDKFIPPNMVNVVYMTGPDVTGVAATGGGVMTVNSAWCDAHPEDTGLTVHETAHVIQAYSAYDPVWLVEGIADYIRWVRFEPQNFHLRINPEKSTYHDSYQTTAAFLGWCELHYDPTLVTNLSRAVRFDTFKIDMFKQYCGKDVDTLWAEFVKDYQANPDTILTPPVPPADRPRTLPTVQAGTGVAVDLSSAFNAIGLSRDGAAVAATAGVDGEGNTYPALSLGTSQTWKDVPFTFGPANANDLVAAQGQTIPLPPGGYSSLWLLGSAVEGNQMAQTFTITYTDGTTVDLLQNLSDWYQPRDFPGESRAFPLAYRLGPDGTKDPRTFYIYSYGFPLDHAKTVKSITLPNNPLVKILAVTLAN